jgi:peptidoglycan/LPS O-acetylase OafA/YrhL
MTEPSEAKLMSAGVVCDGTARANSMEQAAPRKPPLKALTGIRIFAAVMVVLFHYGASFAETAGYPTLVVNPLRNGFLGVSLFFILSGFIIFYQYGDDLRSGAALRRYALARFARIYPVYLLALLISLPMAFAAADGLTMPAAGAVLALVQSWTPPTSGFGYSWLTQAWTLSVEAFFYLTAPLLFLALKDVSPRLTNALLVALGFLICLLAVPVIHPAADYLAFDWMRRVPIPFFRLIEFSFGACLCKAFVADYAWVRKVTSTWPTVANLAAIVGIVCLTRNPHWTSFAMALCGLLLVQLTNSATPVSRLLGSPLLLLLGGASYSVYILQGPVRFYLMEWMPHGLDRVLNLPAVLALSIAVFLLFEEPARRAIVRRSRRRASAVTVC